MHHPGRGRQKARRTDRCGRTAQVISCMRLVEPLDLREHEVCRNVKTLHTSWRANVKLPVEFAGAGSLGFEVGGVAAHRTAVRQCSSGRAAVNPSRVGLCFAVWDQHSRLRYHLSGRLHRRTWLCSRRLSRHGHVIWLREGLISMGMGGVSECM